ncbi:MAG: AMP-binding protein [Microbacteriaceae bacterium]
MHRLVTVDPTDTSAVIRGMEVALAGGDALCVSSETSGVTQVHDDCALVVLTSGSTAAPKRVMLSAESLRASAAATGDALGDGRWVLALPLTYIAGLMVVVRSLESGSEPVVFADDDFSAEAFCEFTHNLPDDTWFTALVPTQLARLVDLAERDDTAARALSRFAAILVGGQAIPAQLVERATRLGARVVRTYGSAETAGGVVYDGMPIGDTQLRVNDDGILEVSSSSLAIGYLGDDARTVETFVDGWFRTSDRAHFDDGRLVIDGRADDIIVTGGVKVSLADIDRVLEQFPGNARATWFTDDEWGQVPAIVADSALNLDDVRALVENELGKAARPYRLVTVDHLPVLSSGKSDRNALHEIAEGNKP